MPDNHWLVAMSKYAFRRFQLNGSPIFLTRPRPKTKDLRPKTAKEPSMWGGSQADQSARHYSATSSSSSSRFGYKNIYIFSSLYLRAPLTDMPRWRMLCGGVFSFFSDSHYLSTSTLQSDSDSDSYSEFNSQLLTLTSTGDWLCFAFRFVGNRLLRF